MRLRRLLLLLITLTFTTGALAQTNNQFELQVIHNAPDDALSPVDVYEGVGGTNILTLDFREASSFANIGFNGNSFDFGLVPEGGSVTDTIGFTLDNLNDGDQRIVVVNGVLPDNSGDYEDFKELDISVMEMPRKSANNSNNTDLLVNHGAPGAGNVDIEEVGQGAGKIVSDLAYGAYAGYLELPTEDYELKVTPSGSDNALGRYEALLSTQNFDGDALTVFASGFLNPADNNDGPEFGLFATTSGGSVIPLPEIERAQIQFIHNSPDQDTADQVDVYVNGKTDLPQDGLGVNDFSFREATEFKTVPANTDIDIDISNWRESINNAYFSTTINLDPNTAYIAVVNGAINSEFSDKDLGISLKKMARTSGTQDDKVDVLAHHGSPDAPAVDVVETKQGAGQLFDSLTYGDFSDYLSVDSLNYELEVQGNANNNTVAKFSAPLNDLNLDGGAVTLLASGFLTPGDNNDGPSFGLYAALPNGQVQSLQAIQEAQVQFIHNVPDDAASDVDVYVNGDQFTELGFQEATSFATLPANEEVNIGLAPAGQSVDDTLKNFTLNLSANSNYIAVANGIASESGYDPNQPLELSLFEGARTVAQNDGQTEILLHHGSTDAPAVNIVETSVTDNQELANGLAYTNFSENGYLPLDPAQYEIEVRDTDGNEVATFDADLTNPDLTDSAITVFASGFLEPENNSNGDPFGLYVALADGTVVELDEVVGIEESANKLEFQAYPNPVNDEVRIAFGQNDLDQARIDVMTINGKVINSQRTAANGNARLNLDGLNSGTYIVRVAANGETVGTKTIVKE